MIFTDRKGILDSSEKLSRQSPERDLSKLNEGRSGSLKEAERRSELRRVELEGPHNIESYCDFLVRWM